jgi:hypothetical protein
MIRLGLKVPATWMVPHKSPTPIARFDYMASKFADVASKYNLPFDLAEIAKRIGYPLYLKPFDGGQWVGVSRVADPDDLRRGYDESGQRLMHLQRAVDDFDVFTRSLSIGPDTMVMRFRPERPMHDRYEVAHDFLTPEQGWEVVTISRLVNAFFRWEFNSCETIVKGTDAYPIDYANASPDVALTSLHYYFPWAIEALVRWTLFCAATRRRMQVALDLDPYLEIADREDLDYEQKLREYRRLADEYFKADELAEFAAETLPSLHELVVDYVAGDEFDRLLVETVRSTFPQHEQEHFVAHYRGLLQAWVSDQG